MTSANIVAIAAVLVCAGYMAGMLAWLFRPVRAYDPPAEKRGRRSRIIPFRRGTRRKAAVELPAADARLETVYRDVRRRKDEIANTTYRVRERS
jgi:hypothetical protein